jgi:tRNA 2-thiouridine synthesizing protein A
MPDNNLDQAVALSRSGRKLEARKILNDILRSNLHNETAWLWFADTFTENNNRIRVMEECIRHNPNCYIAQKWLITFKAQEEARKAAAEHQVLPDFQSSPAVRSGIEVEETVEPGALKKYDQLLDCSGLDCPLPIMRTKRTMDNMQTGQVLKMIATDISSLPDIEAWTSMTGHKLLEHEIIDQKYIFYIEHK